MIYPALFMSLVLPILLLAAVVVFLVVMIKKGAFSTKANPHVTMQEGEASILASRVVWMRKAFYANRHNIPNGVLDITNQRVVYTRLSGEKVDFALEKDEIAKAVHRGKIGFAIQAKDGTNYVINIMPPTQLENALEQMGIPVSR